VIGPGYGRRPKLTLSPLARPGKAIALEAQIELWSAIIAAVPLFSFRRRRHVLMNDRIFGEAGSADRLDGVGAGCPGSFSLPAAGRWETVSLDSPFHRTTPSAPPVPGEYYLSSHRNVIPSWDRRGGCASRKCCEATFESADGVVSKINVPGQAP